MTFSALSGVSFNLSRLFLRLCRWILVKMSLNCKCSASKQKMGTNFKLKKAKESLHGSNRVWKWSRHLLFLSLFGVFIWFIGFFYGLNDGASRTKEETLDLCQQHKARILLEHFNVSNQLHQSDQITSLKCTKKLGYEMLPRNVKVQHSENQEFGNQHDLVAENVELQYQCPVRDETVARKFRVSLPEDKSLSVALHPISSSIISNNNNREKNVLETRAFRHSAEEHCESFSFCLVKACWWVLLGVVLGRIMPYLYENLLGNQKQKLFQQQEQQQKQQQQTRSSSRSAGNWRKRLLYLFVAAGVIGSGWLFFHLNNEIAFRRKETLASMCDERARMLQDQFNVSMNHVHALAILVSTFHHGKQPSAIDQKTFGEYTERTSFERPLTSGVAYALRVLHSERKQFEKQHGWTIKKMENEDQTLVQDCNPENLDPSPLQDEYAPVIFSQETVSHIVSIDMMSGKDDRENILRARASGKGVLTSPFKLLKSNHLGVVLTFAVYSTHLPPNATPEQRINATVGYLGASYDVPSLVEKLLHQLASKQTIVVNVYDTTNKSAPIKMYGGDVIDTGLLQISNLDFGDPARKHEMQCRFKQKPPPPWTAIAALMGVLVITFLLGHIFDAAINRIAKVEQDFQEMMELKHRAEAADIAKSQFLATVSHEIRTPMNGVLGMLQRLMHTDLDANQRDCAETAHGCGRDLISLINEVLDQAKIESGRLDLEDIPFDLRDVLDKILSLFFIKSHEKGIELAVYVSNQIPAVVVGDPGRFRQIITNLVGNSIKFTHDKGHILVSVHLADEVRFPLDVRDEVLRQSLTLVEDWSRNSYNTLSGIPVVDRWKSWKNFKKFSCTNLMEETEKIKLLVTVEDTGVGIPQEAQCRIFMPFMQADSSTSRTYGGTGIGLSISKRLVDLMGGEIGFVSEPGVGSTFSFTAVLRKGETSSLDTMQQQYDPAVLEFQGLRALVVDDKSIRAEVTRYHLQRLGITTDVAFSLDSACAYLSSASNSSVTSHIAMILIDNDVWGMDASLPFHRLIEELRSNGRKEVPERLPKIFLLTTSISNTERNELKLAGLVDNVLMKPLRLNMLIFCFKEVLGIGKKRQRNRGKPLTGNLLRNKRILVVDDNVINRKVAEGVLKMYEAIVTCVDSGKAALEKLKPPHNFDACFMDLQMPEMDGFEATRQIRSLEREVNERIESGEATIEMFANVAHWHTPILAMTADVIQATNEECMKCGMDDYVSKPFAEEQLYSAVARFFESG